MQRVATCDGCNRCECQRAARRAQGKVAVWTAECACVALRRHVSYSFALCACFLVAARLLRAEIIADRATTMLATITGFAEIAIP